MCPEYPELNLSCIAGGINWGDVLACTSPSEGKECTVCQTLYQVHRIVHTSVLRSCCIYNYPIPSLIIQVLLGSRIQHCFRYRKLRVQVQSGAESRILRPENCFHCRSRGTRGVSVGQIDQSPDQEGSASAIGSSCRPFKPCSQSSSWTVLGLGSEDLGGKGGMLYI